MGSLIKNISQHLAEQPSRRGFFSIMWKVALGTAGVVAGEGFFAHAAEAAPYCCSGAVSCGIGHCPTGTSVQYTWTCGHPLDGDSGDYYICHDCYQLYPYRLVCVYATTHD